MEGKRLVTVPSSSITPLLSGALILFGLYLSSLYSYLLFHSLAEIFSIVVACGTFLVFWNSRQFLDNNYFLFVAISYLFFSGIDLVHTLAYRGMGVFPGYDANLPTQLWIAARYVQSISLLVAPLFIHRRLRPALVLAAYIVVTSLLLGSIFYWGIFPDCFVEGVGLTPFKKTSEYIISLILLASIALLVRRKGEFDTDVFRLLVGSTFATIGSELAFTFYISVYGFSNLVGHFLKIVSVYLTYKALIELSLTKPQKLLFRDLKQSEQALRESEERFRRMADNIRDGLTIIERGKAVYMNDRACEILGYPRDELADLSNLDVAAPEEKKRLQRIMEDAWQTGIPPEELEFLIIRKDGSRRWVHNRYSASYEGDEVDSRYVVTTDITERKRAEEALRESEEKLRLIFENAFDGINIQEELPGRTRRLLDCNERYAQMAGRSKQELLEIGNTGKIQRDLGPVRSEEENLRIRRERISYKGLFSWVRPDGAENIIEYSAAPIQVGERALTIGIDRDITEWVRAEEALREYSERLEEMVKERTAVVQAQYAQMEAILRSVGDAILMADQDMRIRYINPAFAALTGYTEEESLGQHASSVGAGAGSEQARQSIESALTEGRMWQGEVTGQRKDGRTYDAALTIAPVRDAESHLIGYVSSYQDISQTKDLERARNQFITNVSHQFRTPVTTLRLHAHLMRQTELPEKSRHHLQAMEEQIAWLTGLIQDTLEMTALDSGKAVTIWDSLSLSTLIEDTITRYQSRAESFGVNLVAMPVPSDLPIVKGAPIRMAQALGKIMDNAITFTPSGGQVVLEVGAAEDDGQTWVTIAVQDTGPGIPPEEQEKVFDRFFRGSLAESGHIPGTGLGLSIAQEIVHAHGGRIVVESPEGVGTTVTIWLPPAA